jgi:hypothetical protein
LPWNTHISQNAAGGGHLEVLQWLHSNGCPCEIITYVSAAEGGHLAILKWADANGYDCKFNNWVFEAAKNYGHHDIIEWIVGSSI